MARSLGAVRRRSLLLDPSLTFQSPAANRRLGCAGEAETGRLSRRVFGGSLERDLWAMRSVSSIIHHASERTNVLSSGCRLYGTVAL